MVDSQIALAADVSVPAGDHRDPFQKSQFAAAEYADDDRDRPVETEFEIIAQLRQAERIGLTAGDPRWVEPDALEVRRRQVDRFVSSRHARSPINRTGSLNQ